MSDSTNAPPDRPEPDAVWVYQYLYWDDVKKEHTASKRFATVDVIKCGLGTPILASGKKVPKDKLIDGAFAE